MPEGKNLLEVIGQDLPTHVDSGLKNLYLLIAYLTGLPSKKGVIYVALSEDSTTTAYLSEIA